MVMQAYVSIQKKGGWINLQEDWEIYSLQGKEREEFLNSYCTQDIKGLQEQQAVLGAFLTQKGKLVSDAVIIKDAEQFLILFPKTYGTKVLEHLKVFLNFADVELKEIGAAYSHFAVRGGLNQVSQSLFKDFSQLKVFATARFGSEAWEILAPRSLQETLIKVFIEFGLEEISPELWEVFRIEAGLPKMGVDMNQDNLVAEVGLDKRATSFKKGCYLGQETTARVDSRGHVNRKLTLLRLEQEITSALPLEIFQGEQKVGSLTSATFSPQWEGVVGLGVIQNKALESGETLVVFDGNQQVSMTHLLSQSGIS